LLQALAQMLPTVFLAVWGAGNGAALLAALLDVLGTYGGECLTEDLALRMKRGFCGGRTQVAAAAANRRKPAQSSALED